jgi:hypothetical protein
VSFGGKLCASSKTITLPAIWCKCLQAVDLQANNPSKKRTEVVIISLEVHLSANSCVSSENSL